MVMGFEITSCSSYTPGQTLTTSPGNEASIAAWIEVYCAVGQIVWLVETRCVCEAAAFVRAIAATHRIARTKLLSFILSSLLFVFQQPQSSFPIPWAGRPAP